MKILIVDDERMVLETSKEAVEELKPDAEVICADRAGKALKLAEEQQIDVALLDIDMPGMNGLQLAKKLKDSQPDVNIIFVTAYSEYALDAFSLYASGYLLKPLQVNELKTAFEHLRTPVVQKEQGLRVQCFGTFEVFYKGKPLNFARMKAKEIFAYLISLNGASANTGELCAVLWEDSADLDRNKHYLRNLMADLKKTLKEYGVQDCVAMRRNQYAVVPEKIDCDYYRFLKHDANAVNLYHGEFMKQYSWAEFTLNIDNTNE